MRKGRKAWGLGSQVGEHSLFLFNFLLKCNTQRKMVILSVQPNKMFKNGTICVSNIQTKKQNLPCPGEAPLCSFHSVPPKSTMLVLNALD